MKPENISSTEKIEDFIETRTPYFEGYLDHIEKDYGIKLTYNIRLKNIHEFKQMVRSFFDPDFLTALTKRYDIVGNVGATFDKDVIQRNKKGISSGEITIITTFREVKDDGDEVQIERIFLLRRKNSFGNFRQKIKKLVTSITPGGKEILNPF